MEFAEMHKILFKMLTTPFPSPSPAPDRPLFHRFFRFDCGDRVLAFSA
jgi:hypothetical protein